MKKSMSIIMSVFVLLIAFACGNKKEENAETTVATEDATATTTTLEERRARLQKERADYEERRRLALEEKYKTAPTYTDAKGKIVYNKAEVNPAFGATSEELEKYLQDNINYPQTAENDQVEGTLFTEFVVGSDGAVRDVEVTEATNDAAKDAFREEAVRVVSGMPKWNPGTQAGKPVDVRVSLPITFQLD
jgi:TonB family protein